MADSTINTALRLTNEMSPVIESVTRALNMTISAMDSVQMHGNRMFDSSTLNAARNEINRVNAEIARAREHINNNTNAQRNFNNTVRQSGGAFSGIKSQLKSMLGMYAIFQGAKTGMQATDNYSGQEARLKLINDGLQTQEQLQNKIFDAAQRSRSSYTEMVDSVAKLGMLAGNAFKNNDEMIRFNEIMQKSYALSGADTAAKESSMRQLIQAMASGRLQGDELVSVREGAPKIYNAIKTYMNKTDADMKDLSAQGAISAEIIKNAVSMAGKEIERDFKQIPMTFGEANVMMKNVANREFANIMKMVSEFANSPIFQQFSNNFEQAMHVLKTPLSGILWLIGTIFTVITRGWNFIAPVISIVLVSLALYKGALLGVVAVKKISAFWSMMMRLATALYRGGLSGLTRALLRVTVGQQGLNAAMMASPITWVVVGIMLIVGALYLGVAAFNALTGSSISATGIIVGAIFWAGGLIYNIFLGLANFIIGIIGKFINVFIGFANFLSNVFNNPISSVINAFRGMANTILGIIKDIAGAIDFVLGSNLSSTVQGWMNNVDGLADRAIQKFAPKEKYEEKYKYFNSNLNDMGLKRVDLTDIYQKGYDYGKNITNIMKLPPTPLKDDTVKTFDPSMINEKLDKGNKNQKAIKDSIDKSNDNLKIIKDMATAKAMNKISLGDVKVIMSNEFKNVNRGSLGWKGELSDTLRQQIMTGLEGVYTGV